MESDELELSKHRSKLLVTNENKAIDFSTNQYYRYSEEKLRDLALKLIHKQINDNNDNCNNENTNENSKKRLMTKSKRKQERISHKSY